MMTKGMQLLVATWCVAGAAAWAQHTPIDTLRSQEDNADFTFSESQLDENQDASQAVASVVTKSDPFLNQVGFRFMPMRFRLRGLDAAYEQTYMNGLRLNDLELGRFNYSSLGGLNDATRNREGVEVSDYNNFGLTSLGGGQSLNTRASRFAEGSKLTFSLTNRNYMARTMYTYATGLMSNGWALAASVGYRGAIEGVIEGTFYNSAAYFLAAEKRLNATHSLSFVTYGSPTERAQQGASTEEAYWLANSHYYNPNWGYQGGKKRNSRVVNAFSPTTIFTWDWNIEPTRTKLTTNAAFVFNQYSNTALGWNGDAYDPRPDYYKNLPSSVGDVWDDQALHYVGKEDFLREQWTLLRDHWKADKANRQVNWDRMYHINRQNEANGGEALYYQERRHNDQRVWMWSSTLNHHFNQRNKVALGLYFNHTRSSHYKTMADLLGGTRYSDIDKFAVNDYGPQSREAQNDLLQPNRQIGVGDKFGYDYLTFINHATLWSNYQYTSRLWQWVVATHLDGTTLEREGLMKNGRYPNNSYGSSGVARFLTGGAKTTLTLSPTRNHRITLHLAYDTKAPLARNAWVAARSQGNFIDRLTPEEHLSLDLSYNFRWGRMLGKVGGYYTQMRHLVEQTAYYNDQQSTFTYLTMTNIAKEYYGLEAGLEYQLTSNFSINALASVGDALYANNPYAQVSYEGMNPSELSKLNRVLNPVTQQSLPMQVIAKGMREDSTPLTALSVGAKYSLKGWFFEASASYYDRVYVSFSPYRRLNSTYATDGHFYLPSGTNASGKPAFEVSQSQLDREGGILFDKEGQELASYAAAQEKFKGGLMIDASIGRYFRLRGGKSLSVNLSLQNLANNTNLRTGGYEQNRSDFYYKESSGSYSKGEGKAYKFSKNSKYYYANAFNLFFNLGFRF